MSTRLRGYPLRCNVFCWSDPERGTFSIPVTPTSIVAGQRHFRALRKGNRERVVRGRASSPTKRRGSHPDAKWARCASNIYAIDCDTRAVQEFYTEHGSHGLLLNHRSNHVHC